MREIRLPLVLLAAFVLLTTLPAIAETYFLTLKNGNVFESRYRPQIAGWDENKVLFVTSMGNRISLNRSDIASVEADSEMKGFGTVIDTNTIALGIAPNDAALPEEAQDPEARLMTWIEGMNAENQRPDYSVQQFVEPDQAGMTGGLPAWDLAPGSIGGGGNTNIIMPRGGGGGAREGGGDN
jgi:hypothetical protein